MNASIALAHLMRRGHPAALVGCEQWSLRLGRVEFSLVHGRVFAKTEGGDWIMVTSIAELDGWIAGGVA